MAKIEIEEAELANLRQVNQFASSALSNPKTRESMLKIQKALNPDAVIPELDAADQVMKAVKGVEDKVDGMMKSLNEERTKLQEDQRTSQAQQRMAAGQKLLVEHGYNAEGVAKIEKLMLDEGIVSYAAGIAYFEKLNPPSAPADNSRVSRFGSLSDNNDIQADDYKELWESQGVSENWLQQSLAKVRSEFN